MNRFHRRFSLPFLFASFAVSAVVVLGEPVENAAAQSFDELAPTHLPVSALSDARFAAETALQQAERASRMRWMITSPHAPNRSCCRKPI